MTLLGELVLGFVVESLVLAAVWSGVAGSAAWLVDRFTHAGWPRSFVFALIGAVAAGSLARRFGLPVAWELDVGRRALPMVWSIGGGLIGAALAGVRRPERV